MTETTKQSANTDCLQEQLGYTERVKKLISKRYAQQPLAFVHTYGCQQNVSDSEKIKGLLVSCGYEMTDSSDDADFVLFNTCAVRENAEDRVYGHVGQLKHNKRKKPGMIVALCGCMTQQPTVADKIKRSYPYVDILFGTHVRHRLPEFIYRHLAFQERVFENSDSNNDIVEGLPVVRDGTFKAWLPIMHGCNNFCTYCIVPYVRGREYSREPEAVIEEAKQLIASGVKEIMLLGQNVNSYGKGADHGVNFAKLLRMVNDLEGDFRIRFMTSHPKDCTEELLHTMAECDKVCLNLHLPVQAGSDITLRRMNRHYNSQEYLKLVKTAREIMPDIQLSSDIIVGFPGETYKDFKCTLDLIEQVRYYSLYTFIYSPRKGTPAAEMPDEISYKEKSKWFTELLERQEQISHKINESLVGKTFKVLCEEKGREDGHIIGRTEGNAVIDFCGDESLIGTFTSVQIIEFDGSLKGIKKY
ncbi:MAG: tRNA (N6-isopentenyl adenosine(37)-C2)-methylthiotransferase MiaB [Oscillospiraceae bacterium]|nr:tRNA (N6-isopentenyl adenosine(37)-C2)-methylthiotransferase MiaB [Oscillospiraceae bacterium]